MDHSNSGENSLSTLGRKAMKKTLERLKKDAIRDGIACMNVFKELWVDINKMSEEEKNLLILLSEHTPQAVISLCRYIQALEDYGYELDEEWDKLLKNIEEAREAKPKPVQKKTSYIK